MLGPRELAALRASLAAVAPEARWTALDAAVDALAPLSLRARTDLVAEALIGDLGDGYGRVASVFRAALDDPGFSGWQLWPVTETAVTLALRDGSGQAFDDALGLLAELTPRLTSEFAIRRLLVRDLDRALPVVTSWCAHPDPKVRRLASEGTRPYLPWAIRVPELITRPTATLLILDALHDDPDEVVRRSVANHLNDLARHAPDEVVATAARWTETGTPGSAWVVRHGLRTLIKKAHPGALELLGFPPAAVEVTDLRLAEPSVRLPGELAFGAVVTNQGEDDARLAVDYVIHYVKANGALAPKVFKLGTLVLAPGQSRRIAGRHAFRQMTTRRHYAGAHALELQINGTRHGRAAFDVLA
ncbi:DNA alkylation repair protein [Arthrobacter ginkgonis]|uniref:DNA alkylation repair protein n=2 Tax=Arthrobacter ginkgonis TaxID=1630594 RepID=A0ABP7C1G3_9MICC